MIKTVQEIVDSSFIYKLYLLQSNIVITSKPLKKKKKKKITIMHTFSQLHTHSHVLLFRWACTITWSHTSYEIGE